MDSGPERCVSLLSRSRGTYAPHFCLSPPVRDWHWPAEGWPVRQEAAWRQGRRGTGDMGERRGAALRPQPHHHGNTDVVCKALTELVTSSASLAVPVQCPSPPCLTHCHLSSRPSLSVASQQSLLPASPPRQLGTRVGRPPFCPLVSSSPVSP